MGEGSLTLMGSLAIVTDGFYLEIHDDDRRVPYASSRFDQLAERLTDAARTSERLVRMIAGEHRRGTVSGLSFRPRTWEEAEQIAEGPYSGVAVLAAQVHTMLYRSSLEHDVVPLLNGARAAGDIALMARVLAIFLLRPWEWNIDGGWFVYCLRTADDSDEFDADRACAVLNALYDLHPVAAQVLVRTLDNFVLHGTRLGARVVESGQLRTELLLTDESPKLFLSYAREHEALADRLYHSLALSVRRVHDPRRDRRPAPAQ